jgi:hypothetical protein
MSTLKKLQQQKAELDLKIAQSLETAKRISIELEEARLRQQEIDAGTFQIRALMEKYHLSKEDLFPSNTPSEKATHMRLVESKTLSEMRQFFNR